MKVTLRLDEVELAETDSTGEAVRKYAASLRESSRIMAAHESRSTADGQVRGSLNELDLRGMTSDDAVMAMERFIDNAVLSGLHVLTVIHGKGTGALRAAVHNGLKNNRYVKSYRLGKYGEGDTGVTIVELKHK